MEIPQTTNVSSETLRERLTKWNDQPCPQTYDSNGMPLPIRRCWRLPMELLDFITLLETHGLDHLLKDARLDRVDESYYTEQKKTADYSLGLRGCCGFQGPVGPRGDFGCAGLTGTQGPGPSPPLAPPPTPMHPLEASRIAFRFAVACSLNILDDFRHRLEVQLKNHPGANGIRPCLTSCLQTYLIVTRYTARRVKDFQTFHQALTTLQSLSPHITARSLISQDRETLTEEITLTEQEFRRFQELADDELYREHHLVNPKARRESVQCGTRELNFDLITPALNSQENQEVLVALLRAIRDEQQI